MTYIFRFILFIFFFNTQLVAIANLSCKNASLHENIIISRYQEKGLTFLDWNSSNQQASNETVIQSNQNGFYDISYNNKGELYATISTHELIKLNPLTGQIISNQGLIAGSGVTNPPVALVGDKEGFLYSVTSKNSKSAIVKFLPNTPQNTILVAYVDTISNINSYGGDLAWSGGYLYWTVTSNNVVRLVKVDTNLGNILFNKAIKYGNGSIFATSPVPMFNDSEGNLLLVQNKKIYNLNSSTAIVLLKESVTQAINIPTGGANNYEFCASSDTKKGKVWFDKNRDGLQNDGQDSMISGVKVELYQPSKNIVVSSKITNNLGEYIFNSADGYSEMEDYEIRIRKLTTAYPVTKWMITSLHTDVYRDIDSDASLVGDYWVIPLPKTSNKNEAYSFGFKFLKETGCLATNSVGFSDEDIPSYHPNGYNFNFSGKHVIGFCAERTDKDPIAGDEYEVHPNNRQQFTMEQKEKISRLYAGLSDPEIIFTIASAFSSNSQQLAIDVIFQDMTWYYTYYNENMNAMTSNLIDNNFNYTDAQELLLKKIAIKLANKVDGINGETQYVKQNIYWLWNKTKNTRQDMIVPAIYAPNSSCQEKFECNNKGIIFTTNVMNQKMNSLSTVNLDTKIMTLGNNFGTRAINAMGYNVQDNFIYGIGFKNALHNTIDVVKIGKNYTMETLNIEGLPQGDSIYALGDVDFHNTLYVSTIQSQGSNSFDGLKSLILIDLAIKKVKQTIPLKFPNGITTINAADYAFNPKDNMLYTIDSILNQLIRINPKDGTVELLGDIGDVGNSGKTLSVISFFDINGNFLFTNNQNKALYTIDISSPHNINTQAIIYIDNLPFPTSGDGAKCAYSKPFSKSLFTSFNIERTNSHIEKIGNQKRNAWYTQIVGRDFDYSIVAYDTNMSSIKEIQDITFKITLHNNETNSTINEMLPYYGHFSASNPTHRLSIGNPNDLNQLSAYKNVVFQISYAIDANGSLIQSPCPSGDFKTCFNNLASISNIKTVSAKDNFSIRPKAFLLNIEDNGTQRINNDIPHSIRLATGYNYQLNISAVDNGLQPILSYKNSDVKQAVIFMGNKVNCQNTGDNNQTISFNNGQNIDNNFSHEEVGIYLLTLLDSSWTQEDSKNNKEDCLRNSSLISINGNELSGCNIVEKNALTLNYYPHHFNIDISINTLPSSGHDEFLYMSEINASTHDFALQFSGEITAKSKNNLTTKNFTTGCASENIKLIFDSNITSDTGVNTPLFTTKNSQGMPLPISFKRVINYNDSTFKDDGNVATIASPLIIGRNRFLDNNAGTLNLDVRYNIDKNITQPINPIAVHSSQIKVTSSNANSVAAETINYTPKGIQALNDTHFFYYARVTPESHIYPRVHYTGDPIAIKTPLSVEIFCLNSSINFCQDMKVLQYSNSYSSPNIQMGWYLSSHHNPTLDGQVTQLKPLAGNSNTFDDDSDGDDSDDDDSVVEVVTTTISPSNNITFQKGNNTNIKTIINSATNKLKVINIILPNQLKYTKNPLLKGNPQYSIPVSAQASGEWSGVGKTGHILNTVAKNKKSGKVDW